MQGTSRAMLKLGKKSQAVRSWRTSAKMTEMKGGQRRMMMMMMMSLKESEMKDLTWQGEPCRF